MRLPFHRKDDNPMELKMTPMIDVIFLLLIFFVCTANFQQNEELLPTILSLPGTSAETIERPPELEDLDDIVVRLEMRGGRPEWEINGRRYGDLSDVAGVLRSIAAFRTDLPVVLDVGDDVPIERMIDLYDLCRRFGFYRVQVAAPVDV